MFFRISNPFCSSVTATYGWVIVLHPPRQQVVILLLLLPITATHNDKGGLFSFFFAPKTQTGWVKKFTKKLHRLRTQQPELDL